jgi:hypothetical protein
MREPLKHRALRVAYETVWRLNPRWVSMNNRYDYEWDVFLTTALDLNMLKIYDLSAAIGDRHVWVGNFPYAYGMEVSRFSVGDLSGRPSFRTIKRLRALEEQCKTQTAAQG